MSAVRFLLACVAALAAVSCSDPASGPRLYPLARPEHVALLCFGQEGVDGSMSVKPLACCGPDPLAPPIDVCGAGTVSTALHALVTQTERGEVAAIDLNASGDRGIQDSNRQVPGYTFVDTGGLPTAIAVSEAVDGTRGPPWFFVASAEQWQIRAVPTCRVRRDAPCTGYDAAALAPEKLQVQLEAAPGDMLLGPDGALWVTLPSLAQIVRIPLAAPEADGLIREAFDSSAPRGYFRVPEVREAVPPEPVIEERYAEVCGIAGPEVAGAPVPASSPLFVPVELELPMAPRAPLGELRPTRMRYDPASAILFVADASSPILHTFRLTPGGELFELSALPTGAPLRDFALTEPVPATVQSTVTKRYLYAIDDRDGSVMVFELIAPADGTPALRPLVAPLPNGRFRDRIDLPSPAAALDVISNRQTDCDPADPGSLHPDFLVDSSLLRGVFVAVASQGGALSVIDVVDDDRACRVVRSCGAADAWLHKRDGAAVAVQRHAPRLTYLGAYTAETAGLDVLGRVPCDPQRELKINEASAIDVCAPRDPWRMRSQSVRVGFEGPLPNASGNNGALALVGATPVLEAPAGLDFCALGVLPGDQVLLSGSEREGCDANTGLTVPLTVVEAGPLKLTLALADGALSDALRGLAECTFVRFEVRAEGYLVDPNSLTPYLQHNVREIAPGVCGRHPEFDDRLTRRPRAVEDGLIFEGPTLRLRLSPTTSSGTGTSGGVSVNGGFEPLTRNLFYATSGIVDVLPVSVRYHPNTNELFVLDTASQGLVKLGVTPLRLADTR